MGVSLCLMKMAMTVTVSRIPPQATHRGTMASNESHRMYCISKSKHPRLSSYGHRPGPQSAHLNSFSTYSHGSQRSQLQQQVSPCKSKQINQWKTTTQKIPPPFYRSQHIYRSILWNTNWFDKVGHFVDIAQSKFQVAPTCLNHSTKHSPCFENCIWKGNCSDDFWVLMGGQNQYPKFLINRTKSPRQQLDLWRYESSFPPSSLQTFDCPTWRSKLLN